MHLRDEFFSKLYDHFNEGNKKKFIIVTNDFGSPFLDNIIKDYPQYYINAGICEQHIVTLSCGLASQGFRPIVYSISSFIIYRAFEQIKLDLMVHRSNVCLLTVGSGYAYDVDGPTHHSTEDLSLMLGFDNLTLLNPCDTFTVKKSFDYLLNMRGPVWLRLDRGEFKPLEKKFLKKNYYHENYKGNKKLIVLTFGSISENIFKVKNEIKDKFSILCFLKLKPLNIKEIKNILKSYSKILIVEEHNELNGFGSYLLNLLNSEGLKNEIEILGLNSSKIFDYQKRKILHQKHKLDPISLSKKIKKILS